MKTAVEPQGGLPPEAPTSAPSDKDHLDAISEMERCQAMRASWDLGLMKAVWRIHDQGTHAEMGFADVADLLSSYFDWGYTRAWEWVEVALCLRQLPEMVAAYQAGVLSYDQLRALVQVANDENEGDLIEACRGLSTASTFRLVRKIKKVSSEDSQNARASRFLDLTWDYENRLLYLVGALPEEQGAAFEAAIDALAAKVEVDPEQGDLPLAVRRADALVEAVTGGGDGGCGSGAEVTAEVVVHVDAEMLLGTDDGVAEIAAGPSVSRHTVERLVCDAKVRAVVENSDGDPIAFGRSRRTAPPRLRKEAMARTGGCAWRGCRNRKTIEVHHIEAYSKGGRTDWVDLIALCLVHHRYVHEGGWSIVGRYPDIAFVPPPSKSFLPVVGNGPPTFKREVIEEFARAFRYARGP